MFADAFRAAAGKSEWLGTMFAEAEESLKEKAEAERWAELAKAEAERKAELEKAEAERKAQELARKKEMDQARIDLLGMSGMRIFGYRMPGEYGDYSASFGIIFATSEEEARKKLGCRHRCQIREIDYRKSVYEVGYYIE